MTAEPYPWEREADEYEGESGGFKVRLRRNTEMGTWCGYIIIPEEHPWHGLSYGDLEESGVTVHGGVTYTGDDIFHEEWAVGFDCGHAFDLIPMFVSGKFAGSALETMNAGTYRDMAYVLDECRQLAVQAGKVFTPPPLPRSTDPLDRSDDELRQALRALRGEAEPEPKPEPVLDPVTGTPLEYTREMGETDAEFKRRIIEDNARVAAGMAPRRRRVERKDPW